MFQGLKGGMQVGLLKKQCSGGEYYDFGKIIGSQIMQEFVCYSKGFI